MLQDIAFSSIRIATPLVFAALGGLYTFQAGILNIALDGFMIVGGLRGSRRPPMRRGSLTVGVLAGIAASVRARGRCWRCSTCGSAPTSSSPASRSRSWPTA